MVTDATSSLHVLTALGRVRPLCLRAEHLNAVHDEALAYSPCQQQLSDRGPREIHSIIRLALVDVTTQRTARGQSWPEGAEGHRRASEGCSEFQCSGRGVASGRHFGPARCRSRRGAGGRQSGRVRPPRLLRFAQRPVHDDRLPINGAFRRPRDPHHKTRSRAHRSRFWRTLSTPTHPRLPTRRRRSSEAPQPRPIGSEAIE